MAWQAEQVNSRQHDDIMNRFGGREEWRVVGVPSKSTLLVSQRIVSYPYPVLPYYTSPVLAMTLPQCFSPRAATSITEMECLTLTRR